MGYFLVFQDRSLEGYLDVGDVEVLISDVDKFIDSFILAFRISVIHYEQEYKACLHQLYLVFNDNLSYQLSTLVNYKDFVHSLH
jgi:hypothetical protein